MGWTAIKTAALSILGFGVLCWLAMIIGREGNAPHPAIEGFREGCAGQALACWQSIVPAETTVAETQRMMTGLGYQPSRRSSFGIITYGRVEAVIPCTVYVTYNQATAPIILLRFEACMELRLGDLLDVFGFPDSILPSDGFNTLRYQSHTEILVGSESLSPYSPIVSIEMRPNVMVQAAIGLEWKGLLPQGWYCREQSTDSGVWNC